MSTTAAEQAIAGELVAARQQGRSLTGFPGVAPTSMAQAYRIQDRAIATWPDSLVGWKIGYVAADRRAAGDPDRLVGPIWAGQLLEPSPNGSAVEMPVFVDGFAAVEAELVIRLEHELPARPAGGWTAEEVAGLDQQLLFGIEVASSPIPDINSLGPTVVAADFGNNNGLVLGGAVPATLGSPTRLVCYVDGQLVGAGTADQLPGGIHHALATALDVLAGRGQPVQAGALFATGAITGIHPVRPGQRCRVAVGEGSSVELRTVGADRSQRR